MPKESKMEEDACCGRHRGKGMWRLILGVFLLILGVSWLGNDLGYWRLNLPWAPIAVVIFALGLILGWAMRQGHGDGMGRM